MAPRPPTSYKCAFCGEVVDAGDEITVEHDTGKTVLLPSAFTGGLVAGRELRRVIVEADYCSHSCARAGAVRVTLA